MSPTSPGAGGDAEARRLEGLWRGAFGNAYTARNAAAGAGREPFWQQLLATHPVGSALEVGCNLGGNLRWLSRLLPGRAVYGLDINESALARLLADAPSVRVVSARARELPFRDRVFDLVYTAGVLIHQPPETLPRVMAEIVRCARRYVLASEYYAETLIEVPYHDQRRALYKADFGGLYARRFPELRLVEHGFLAKEGGGWHDVTWWLFERTT